MNNGTMTDANGPPPPQDFICIITQRLMVDAVVDPEGNSYDKAAIEEWLTLNPVSPVTRNPLRPAQLVPNRVLRNMIDQWKKDNLPQETPAAPVSPRPAGGYSGAETPAPPMLPPVQNAKLTAVQHGDLLRVSVLPPIGRRGDVTRRGPASIVCCIDVSGSMSAMTSVKDAAGKVECDGLTQLCLVKHAVRTIINCLDDTDSLALVNYNSVAQTALPLTQMTAANKKKAIDILNNFESRGTTNIWDGCLKAMECLRTATVTPSNPTVMLFTDGQPTVTPPRGHLEMLKRYRDQHSVLPGVLHTFGFGYSLDTKLLVELATEGGGAYNFIPDASLVGTIFVNSLSNHLCRCGDNVVVKVENENSVLAAEDAILGGVEHINASWGVCVELRSVYYGQRRDFVLRLASDAKVDASAILTASYRNFESGEQMDMAVEVEDLTDTRAAEEMLGLQADVLRLQAVDAIRRALELKTTRKPGDGSVRNTLAAIDASPAKDMPRVKDLRTDISGEVVMALESEAFDKWGKHYLPSIMMAHLGQLCNNFKDPGVQHYGGKLFEAMRDKCDDIFLKLPPPTPQRRVQTRASAPRAAPVDMSMYYNRGGGCFSGSSTVVLEGNAVKAVRQVVKGDRVLTMYGDFAEVRCVVRTVVDKPLAMVRLPEGVYLTPYHPVYLQKERRWVFPCDVGSPAPVGVGQLGEGFIYDFVLASGHAVMVSGVPCVTLGHDFAGDVVSHEYFGSQRVVDDLARLPGWQEGAVVLPPSGAAFARDPTTCRVTGLAPPALVPAAC